MTGALDGITLVDISAGISGPYASMLMSEQGADCIKIELPGGDPTRREPAFTVWNRSKRGVVVDYQQPEGREVLYRILRQSDVLVESFTPGEAKNLQLDYATLSGKNPRLVYVRSLPSARTVRLLTGKLMRASLQLTVVCTRGRVVSNSLPSS